MPPRRFKLLAPLPILVEFKSRSFQLKLETTEFPNGWRFSAYVDASRFNCYWIANYPT